MEPLSDQLSALQLHAPTAHPRILELYQQHQKKNQGSDSFEQACAQLARSECDSFALRLENEVKLGRAFINAEGRARFSAAAPLERLKKARP